jgi:uncharacterized OB-fold protein
MNKFENELKSGNFIVTECLDCKQIVWPASDFCSICHSSTKWRNTNNIGKIIEFSKKNDKYFGLIEIEKNLRVMGEIISEKTLETNQKVKLKESSFEKTSKFIFEVISN